MDASWTEANQRYLVSAVAALRAVLEGQAGPSPGASTSSDDERAFASAPPAGETLVNIFGLAPFERNVLLLCAGIELDGGLAAACATANGDAARPYPTFGLALAALPDAHWSALTPAAPLRRWQ